MRNDFEKMMSDIMRQLNRQNIRSQEDMKKVLDNMMKIPIAELPDAVLNEKEKAQNLVFEAYEMGGVSGKYFIDKALEIDPDCIEAYEFLAETESSDVLALLFLEKAIEIGRRTWGGDYLTEHKGNFWQLFETKPFIRCLNEYASLLTTAQRYEEAIALYKEIIDLNNSDNLGTRHLLSLLLIRVNDDTAFKQYDERFVNDVFTPTKYNRVLFLFKTHGDGEAANKALSTAIAHNPFVPKKLMALRPPRSVPDRYRVGSEEDAILYALYAKETWHHVDGAIEWLRKNASLKKKPAGKTKRGIGG